MQKETPSLWRLFLATFQLSAFTFGGGYVIVPLMKQRFVEDFEWIEESEMLDLVSIAQSAPGPIAVNASILVGYRVAGVVGALVSVMGTALPPLIIISIISLCYAAFRENQIVSLVLRGMNVGIAAVICDVVMTMGSVIFQKKRPLYNAMMVVVFAIAWFTEISILPIILCSALIGVTDTLLLQKKKKEGEA